MFVRVEGLLCSDQVDDRHEDDDGEDEGGDKLAAVVAHVATARLRMGLLLHRYILNMLITPKRPNPNNSRAI